MIVSSYYLYLSKQLKQNTMNTTLLQTLCTSAELELINQNAHFIAIITGSTEQEIKAIENNLLNN